MSYKNIEIYMTKGNIAAVCILSLATFFLYSHFRGRRVGILSLPQLKKYAVVPIQFIQIVSYTIATITTLLISYIVVFIYKPNIATYIPSLYSLFTKIMLIPELYDRLNVLLNPATINAAVETLGYYARFMNWFSFENVVIYLIQTILQVLIIALITRLARKFLGLDKPNSSSISSNNSS